mmetsp:Transcript_53762/g.153200  ORF Transcript_53762/g.153200 Transcript_53762/m.153200 type:complete len:210 (+) Transcript_53762:321-950(+)
MDASGDVGGPDRSGKQTTVKFWGAKIDNWNENHADTEHRFAAARKLWHGLWKRLPGLRLSRKMRGMLFRSTVLASLYYGAEARHFTRKQLNKYRSFMNRCVRGLCEQRMSEMHDSRLTMADLYHSLGLEQVETTVGKMQLSWLGHLSRLPAERMERQVLWAHLEHKTKKKKGRSNALSLQLQRRLMELRQYTGYSDGEWNIRWQEHSTT